MRLKEGRRNRLIDESRQIARAAVLRCGAFFHPLFEQGNLILGPRFVAGHAAVENARINLLGVSFNIGERREIEAKILHRIHVGSVAEQRANVFCKA